MKKPEFIARHGLEKYKKTLAQARIYYYKNHARYLEQYKKKYKAKRKKRWLISYADARARCLNKNHKAFLYYGGRGIKMLMTSDDFKSLWFRDNAPGMKKPSIDRIDNDGNYEIKNCRFIEQSENVRRNNLIRKRKPK